MNEISRILDRRGVMCFATLLPTLPMLVNVAIAGSLHVSDSRPAADAIVHGRHAEYVIRFDGPVDHVLSRMEITRSGQVIQRLTPLDDSAVDVLFASGETPPPGRYLLHWEVKSLADGTVSEGSIPFSVEP